jgi:DNA relaxase NicK
MYTNNEHLKDRNDDGCPQRGTSEDSTAEATVAPRRVITGINFSPKPPTNLTDCPTVGERITSIPGHNNNAKLIQHPLPNVSAPQDAAIIDWFSCTLHLSPDYGMNELIADLLPVFGVNTLTMSNKGWCGYHQRADLDGFGLLAWEGMAQRDTAHLSLNAHGCGHVPDWYVVKDWGEAHKARIGRVDLAHDDFSGEVWNANILRTEYLQDGFVGSDGRKPKSSLVGDWDNANKGRTYYIGSRAAGKMLRGYEKGKQLGELDNPWFRLELELRGSNRVIPWEILTQPGQYLAGAYPCLSTLSSTPCKIETSIKAASMEYAKTLAHLKKQWGQFINLVLAVEEDDATRVMDKLCRPGFPERFTPQLDFLLRHRRGDDLP